YKPKKFLALRFVGLFIYLSNHSKDYSVVNTFTAVSLNGGIVVFLLLLQNLEVLKGERSGNKVKSFLQNIL
ncbi:MAG TPA: hypothetical protein VN451_03545, partial [Chitinophagaceae bacterium]|nr:hypothetical protein [Chitinophagaceae bacterium]